MKKFLLGEYGKIINDAYFAVEEASQLVACLEGSDYTKRDFERFEAESGELYAIGVIDGGCDKVENLENIIFTGHFCLQFKDFEVDMEDSILMENQQEEKKVIIFYYRETIFIWECDINDNISLIIEIDEIKNMIGDTSNKIEDYKKKGYYISHIGIIMKSWFDTQSETPYIYDVDAYID